MKKQVSLFLCLCAFAAANAHEQHADSHASFTGAYLGGAIGGTNARFDMRTTAEVPLQGFNLNNSHTVSGTAASGLISGGYLYQFKEKFVLGAMATVGYTDIQQTDKVKFHLTAVSGGGQDANSYVKNTAQLTNDFALLLKPGYAVGKSTLFYLLVGPRWGNFKTETESSFTVMAGSDQLIAQGKSSESQYKLGITAGVGVQQMLTRHVQLGLEYLYTSYGRVGSPDSSSEVFFNAAPTGGQFENQTAFDAQTNTVMATVAYQW